jgi:EAL domain-containing protein (putative c-di-GMP-specific phosphodiesterase class I)
VSTVKLDASLAKPQQPPVQPRHDEFLAAVVGLARTLGMTVTAEGIETNDHAQRMHTAGCDTGQGWLLGKPMPAHQIRTRARRP